MATKSQKYPDVLPGAHWTFEELVRKHSDSAMGIAYGIVRNRAKVEATIGNARAYLDLEATVAGGFAGYLDGFVPPPPPRQPPHATMADLPGFTPAAEALSTLFIASTKL